MIEYNSVITNGSIDQDTISSYIKKGYTFLVTLPAKMVHPYAADTDKITLFSKYTPYSIIEDTTCQNKDKGDK